MFGEIILLNTMQKSYKQITSKSKYLLGLLFLKIGVTTFYILPEIVHYKLISFHKKK